MATWKEENLLGQIREESNHSGTEELYAVIQLGGSVGEKNYSIVEDNLPHDEAIDMAKRYRKMLSPGEKKYYRITYKAVPMSKLRKTVKTASMTDILQQINLI